jgi:hypothetical protein
MYMKSYARKRETPFRAVEYQVAWRRKAIEYKGVVVQARMVITVDSASRLVRNETSHFFLI